MIELEVCPRDALVWDILVAVQNPSNGSWRPVQDAQITYKSIWSIATEPYTYVADDDRRLRVRRDPRAMAIDWDRLQIDDLVTAVLPWGHYQWLPINPPRQVTSMRGGIPRDEHDGEIWRARPQQVQILRRASLYANPTLAESLATYLGGFRV